MANSKQWKITTDQWKTGMDDIIFGPKDNQTSQDMLEKLKIQAEEINDANKKKESYQIDFEPITIDRRRDLDYIEKLDSKDANTLIILAELVAQGKADFLFIEYPEISDLWNRHCTNLGKLRAKEADILRKEELKKSALGKLTEEEKQVLGIK